MKFFISIFGGIGILLLAIAGWLFVREQNFLRTAVTTQGTVVAMTTSSDQENGTSYCPVIDFAARNDQKIKYYANICSTPPAYTIGDQVTLIYDPQDPQQVQIKGFLAQYLAELILGVIGAVFTFVGVLTFILSRQRS